MFSYIRRLSNSSSFVKGRRSIATKVKAFFITENIPKISFVIGAVALAVQVMLLYPKHEILSRQFHDVEKVVHRVANVSNALDARLNEILLLEREIKTKERRILDKENEIYSAELNSIIKIDAILELQKAKAEESQTN